MAKQEAPTTQSPEIAFYEKYMKGLYPDRFKGMTVRDGVWARTKKKRRNPQHIIARELDPDLRQEVYQRDDYKCRLCGSRKDLHVHHDKHREDGGMGDPDNLATLCGKCHTKQHEGEPVHRLMKARYG